LDDRRRPKAIFNDAIGWLVERGVLLPGVTTPARVVARVRDEATQRLWDTLAGLLTARQCGLRSQRDRGAAGRCSTSRHRRLAMIAAAVGLRSSTNAWCEIVTRLTDSLGPVSSFDRFQRRHRAIAIPIAVLKKFADDGAGNAATLIAYFGFFSIFPLLLLLFVTILGFVLQGDRRLSTRYSARRSASSRSSAAR
jgi:hypothetical protein